MTSSTDNTAWIGIADDKPIVAELTRRVCKTLTEDQIKATIPSWRGCASELAAVAGDLKEYDALGAYKRRVRYVEPAPPASDHQRKV